MVEVHILSEQGGRVLEGNAEVSTKTEKSWFQGDTHENDREVGLHMTNEILFYEILIATNPKCTLIYSLHFIDQNEQQYSVNFAVF